MAGSEEPEADDSDSEGDNNTSASAAAAAESSDQKTIRFKNSKVIPPRAGGKKLGVFATRSPHRPNPIALSVVRLLSVDVTSKTLEFSCIDLIDGTPILDIKPYHPSDAVTGYTLPEWVATAYAPAAATTAVPTAVASSGDAKAAASFGQSTATTTTTNSAPALPLPVVWSSAARTQLKAIIDSNAIAAAGADDTGGGGATRSKPPPAQPLIFYRELSDITRAIEQVIGADPRSLHNRSAQQFGRGIYGVCVDRLDVAFRMITTTTTASPNSTPIETAEVIQVLYYGENVVRPRMRTAQWFAHMQQLFPVVSTPAAPAPISLAAKK